MNWIHSSRRPTCSRIAFAIVAVAAILCLTPVQASAANAVSQFGITWTFSADRPTGQFANGDWWVVGPVTITAISPASIVSGGVTMHGSMANPAMRYNNGVQGFDSRMKSNTYDAAANVGLSLPRTFAAGTSLLSCKSYVAGATADNPQLETIAILTVLGSAPPAGSFRPPYQGNDKTISWNVSQLDYSVLASLPIVANTPALSVVEGYFERPRIEINTGWTGRYMHPGLNYPSDMSGVGTYGREIAHTLANGLLSLQLNYTEAQKRTLLIRMVQIGIDIYGAARNGASWGDGGGHNIGRKMPMLLAGRVLGDAAILAKADKANAYVFSEDQQTFYVTSTEVGTVHRSVWESRGVVAQDYTAADLGLAEWGFNHKDQPYFDDKNWGAPYRTVAAPCMFGHVLTAHLMRVRTQWNHPPLFDYYDRYYSIASGSALSPNSIHPFVKSMWEAYRNGTSGNTSPTVAAIADQTTAMGVAKAVGVTIGDAQTAVASLQLSATSSNQTLVPNANLVCTGTTAARTLTITPAAGQGGTATITVTVSDGVLVASRSFVLTVTAVAGAPAITTQPQDAAVSVGQTATFAVAATGTATLTYQWQRNGSAIGGATSASYTTPATVLGDDGATFRVVVTNGISNVTSASATLNVSAAAPTWQNHALSAQNGTIAVAFDAVPGGSGLNSVVGLSAAAAGTYTDLACIVRFGAANLIEARNDAAYAAQNAVPYVSGTSYHLRLVVRIATRTYDIYVTPQGGGEITLGTGYAFRTEQAAVTSLANWATYDTVGSGVAVSGFTLTTAPTISAQPEDATVGVGQTATFTVIAAGSATLTYQWQRNGTPIGGATAASYVTPATVLGDDGATYRVVVSNGVGSVTSANATVHVGAISPTWQNHPITAQAGTISVVFDAVPGGSGLDSVIGFSDTAVDAYIDLACIVRFGASNVIDARNGGAYAAQVAMPYATGTTYHIRLVIRIAERTYDVFVTPDGGSEIVLGQFYAFRSEQASVASLANWATYDAAASGLTVSGMNVVSSGGGGGSGQSGGSGGGGSGGGGCGLGVGLAAVLALALTCFGRRSDRDRHR